MPDSKKKLSEIKKTMGALGKHNPEAMAGFQKFMQESKGDGVLSAKIKQLIGIAISITKQCSWCIPYHIKNALDLGATEEEILDASMVAVTFGGGPALMHIRYVLDALEDLK